MFKIQSRSGALGHERLTIKCFQFSDQMHKFLNKGDNALKWHEVPQHRDIYQLKAGTYAFVGQSWVNVKSLDASILAHV